MKHKTNVSIMCVLLLTDGRYVKDNIILNEVHLNRMWKCANVCAVGNMFNSNQSLFMRHINLLKFCIS